MQTDKAYKCMHSMTGCFIKEEPAEKIEEKTYYPFTLVFSSEIMKTYYCNNKEEYAKWCNTIKQLIGYSNLTDFYEIKVIIACMLIEIVGKFGQWEIRHRKSCNS